jgi:hypothetical protein
MIIWGRQKIPPLPILEQRTPLRTHQVKKEQTGCSLCARDLVIRENLRGSVRSLAACSVWRRCCAQCAERPSERRGPLSLVRNSSAATALAGVAIASQSVVVPRAERIVRPYFENSHHQLLIRRREHLRPRPVVRPPTPRSEFNPDGACEPPAGVEDSSVSAFRVRETTCCSREGHFLCAGDFDDVAETEDFAQQDGR